MFWTNIHDFYLHFGVVIWSRELYFSCLIQIFYLFGACAYSHSEWGKLLLSSDFVSLMHSLRIATSNTLVYNPTGNDQREKYNDVIWSLVKLFLMEMLAHFKIGGSVTPSFAFFGLPPLYIHKYNFVRVIF